MKKTGNYTLFANMNYLLNELRQFSLSGILISFAGIFAKIFVSVTMIFVPKIVLDAILRPVSILNFLEIVSLVTLFIAITSLLDLFSRNTMECCTNAFILTHMNRKWIEKATDMDYDAFTSESGKRFSVVFQDFRLLSFSIGQNVAAASQFDMARVKECLRISGFAGKLQRLKRGINQELYHDYEEDGVSLSGGEEQKVAIARAVYKSASFFVLDEPTAALDPVAEYETYKKFDEITGGKTTFFISHRLSSCRFCDEVIVMDHRMIVQQGSHDELVDRPGKYQELWTAQSQYYMDA